MIPHLSALMTYRTAADVLEQMLPVDAGKDAETLRRRTLKIGEALRNDAAVAKPVAAPAAIAVSLDSTFIRSREDSERHLEVRVGNVETGAGGRQVFGAVAKADTDRKMLIADPPQPRCRRANRGHGADRVHRRVLRPATHFG
jgi:hypothetical protein